MADSGETSCQRHTIVDGLQVQTLDLTMSYTCKYLVMGNGPKEVDWKIIVIGGESCGEEHIRCLVLKETDDPSVLIGSIAQYEYHPWHRRYDDVNVPLTKAIVLLNQVDDRVLERFKGITCGCPVLLVSGSEADRLILAMDGREKVKGKVTLNTFDSAATRFLEEASTQDIRKPGYSLGYSQMIIGLITRVDVSVVKLRTDMEHLQRMFASQAVAMVTQDRAMFAKVMNIFRTYEKSAGTNGGSHGKLFRVMLKNLPSVFVRDFPFYVILAYRISEEHKVYTGEEASEFVRTCIEKMETGDPKQLSSTLNEAIQRGCHAVLCGQSCSAVCVFQLLEEACLHFAEVSLGSRQTSGRQIYRSLVWASVALKCHVEHGHVKKWVRDLWDHCLLKLRSEPVFTLDTIEELREGLDWTQLLNIPPVTMLSADQMANLVICDGEAVRPFSHVMKYIDVMNTYICGDQYVTGLVHLNTFLCVLFKQKRQLSVEGTLIGTIQEGLAYVEKLNELLQHNGMENDMCDRMVVKWLVLLLQLVDVTQPGSENHLAMFVTGAYSVLQIHAEQVVQEIINNTKVSLPNIGIGQFLHLYKKFTFWPDEFVEEYLSTYKLLPVCISNATWTALFTEVLKRKTFAQGFIILFEFIKIVTDQYDREGRSWEFVSDLLDMNCMLDAPEHTATPLDHTATPLDHTATPLDHTTTPLDHTATPLDHTATPLDHTATPLDHTTTPLDHTATPLDRTQQMFTHFLEEYILERAVSNGLAEKLQRILSITTDSSNYIQQLVFTVLQKTLPNVISSEAVGKSNIAMLRTVVSKLTTHSSWKESMDCKEKLCWAIVSSCCSETAKFIDPHSIEWIKLCSDLILELGQVYHDVVGSAGGIIPDYLDSCTCGDVQNYLDWVTKICQILREWHTKIHNGTFNYGELLQYQLYYSYFHDVAHKLWMADLVVPMAELSSAKSLYEELFEQVNVHLIKYIPDNMEAKHCTLPEILQELGVQFPQEFLEDLALPPAESPKCLIPANVKNIFRPSDGASVQARQSLTFSSLQSLVNKLDVYVQPILDHMEMLVLFHLGRNGIFKSYVLLQFQRESCVKVFVQPDDILRPYLNDLGTALNNTKILLTRISSGQASYVETIGEGKLLLDTLDIEAESQAITNYFGSTEYPKMVENAKVFSNMLELYQYTHMCIPAIHHICEVYKLNRCLKNPSLTQLMEIAEELIPQREKARQLQPLEVVGILRRIKELLCFKIPKVGQIGSLLSTIAESKKVLQFFCEQEFDVWWGKVRFDVRCCSIRAQLEHNMTMLDHLHDASTFIEPFVDTEQDFQSLLAKMAALDDLPGLKNLVAINSNIESISFWFPATNDHEDMPQSTEALHNNLAGSIKLLSEIQNQNDKLIAENSSLKEALASQQQCYTAHCSELQQQLNTAREELQAAHRKVESAEERHKADLEMMKDQHRAELDEVRSELSRQLLLHQEMIAKHNKELDEMRTETEKLQLQTILGSKLNEEKTQNERLRMELEQLKKEHSMCTSFSPCLIKRSDVKLYQDRHLGGGSWGYVVEGQFRGQKVAVKCVHGVILNEDTLKRVRREVTTMAQVRHPNLVLFIAAVLDNQGGPLIITELLDTTLRNAYEKDLLEPGLDKHILVDIASALSYLHQHEAPIIHRDVSSSNVLLEAMAKARWKAKLSDFGSANWACQAVTLGEGAIAYTAPEAYPVPPGEARKPQTTKIDVYSYGILMGEVALREFPSCDHLEEIKEKMKVCFPDLYPIMMKCIEKDPTKRLTMADILRELTFL